MIALFYLAEPTYGGWVTYTSHLAYSFRDMGYNVMLFKIGNRDESKSRDFGNGLQYLNVTLETAVQVAKTYKSYIVASGPDYEKDSAELLLHGADIVIHDHTEMRKLLLEALKKPVITIGEMNKNKLETLGVKSKVIRHPYMPNKKTNWDKKYSCVSHARVDWDKNTNMLIEANLELNEEDRISVFGSINRLYVHHKIISKLGQEVWDRSYKGKFPKTLYAGVQLCGEADMVIDLSVIKGDGGRTQYTFLEAFDAGTPLVVHRKWLSKEDPLLVENFNVLAIESKEELVEVIKNKKSLRTKEFAQNASEIIKLSAPNKIILQFLSL